MTMNNLSSTITVIIIGLIGGIAVGLQGPMSGAMSQRLGPLGSSLIITLPRVGVAMTTALLILAQMSIGLLLDQFGWLGVPQHSISLIRLSGLVVLLLGAYLVAW
jgi:uncharacterized membrane protein YdcZ (DUF606 family)